MRRAPTELVPRSALFGEPNPLGSVAFMAGMANPIADPEQVGLE